jgi:microsomal dipeptidase-like Zn-dependent dipeptidase
VEEVVEALSEAGLQPQDIAQIERGNALRMLQSN